MATPVPFPVPAAPLAEFVAAVALVAVVRPSMPGAVVGASDFAVLATAGVLGVPGNETVSACPGGSRSGPTHDVMGAILSAPAIATLSSRLCSFGRVFRSMLTRASLCVAPVGYPNVLTSHRIGSIAAADRYYAQSMPGTSGFRTDDHR